jgi:multiple sugar transport system permease protein
MSVAEAPGAAEVTRTGRRGRAPLTERARAERKLAWMLCAPAVIVMLLVTGYPIVYAFVLSLQRYDLRFASEKHWVGFNNYGNVLSSSIWWQDVWHTVVITVFSVALELVLGMLLALAMHKAIWGRGVVRATVLIPYGIVTVVAAFAWRFAFSADSGFIANLFGLGYDPLTKPFTAYLTIILAEVWKTTPFMALLLLAGLALVPEELQEAAKVDGANAVQRFFRITLPLMKPAIVVALLFRTLDAFRIFDSAFIITAGQQNTETVSILGYNQLLVRLNLGLGSAVSVLVFLAVILIAVVFVKGLGASPTAAQRG